MSENTVTREKSNHDEAEYIFEDKGIMCYSLACVSGPRTAAEDRAITALIIPVWRY
jgi:hypothetical protein